MTDITDITNIQREGQEAAEAAAVTPPQPPVKLRLVVFEEPQGTPAAAMGRGGDDKSPATAIGDRLDLRGGGLLTAAGRSQCRPRPRLVLLGADAFEERQTQLLQLHALRLPE